MCKSFMLLCALVRSMQQIRSDKPIQCLTCSSWQPDLDGRSCAEQDTPFQELSDDTSLTAASSQLTPIIMVATNNLQIWIQKSNR